MTINSLCLFYRFISLHRVSRKKVIFTKCDHSDKALINSSHLLLPPEDSVSLKLAMTSSQVRPLYVLQRDDAA